jgi:hypothetical protein
MIYAVTLKYQSLKYCENIYPYFENVNREIQTTENEAKCIKSILDVTEELIDKFIARNYVIYSFKNKTQASFDELLKPAFLLFSIELLNEETIYVVANDNICIDGYDDEFFWIENEKNGIIIANDDDGQCLYFYLNDECKKHEWLAEYLQKYGAKKDEINPHHRKENLFVLVVKAVILVPLFTIMAMIGTIFDWLNKYIKLDTIIKAIIRIFKKSRYK